MEDDSSVVETDDVFGFQTPLVYEFLGPSGTFGEGWHRLEKPLVYCSLSATDKVTVPKNFVCDLSSVPRLPIIYSLFGAKAKLAAVLHDYFWRYGPIFGWFKDELVFREAMHYTDIGSFTLNTKGIVTTISKPLLFEPEETLIPNKFASQYPEKHKELSMEIAL